MKIGEIKTIANICFGVITINHKIYTNRGKIRVDELIEGDEVIDL